MAQLSGMLSCGPAGLFGTMVILCQRPDIDDDQVATLEKLGTLETMYCCLTSLA